MHVESVERAPTGTYLIDLYYTNCSLPEISMPRGFLRD